MEDDVVVVVMVDSFWEAEGKGSTTRTFYPP